MLEQQMWNSLGLIPTAIRNRSELKATGIPTRLGGLALLSVYLQASEVGRPMENRRATRTPHAQDSYEPS
jgi:hypothetical protein